MVECDNCADEVFSVWRFRERGEEMTHCDPSWVCAECHPDLTGPTGGRTAEGTAGEPGGTTAL